MPDAFVQQELTLDNPAAFEQQQQQQELTSGKPAASEQQGQTLDFEQQVRTFEKPAAFEQQEQTSDKPAACEQQEQTLNFAKPAAFEQQELTSNKPAALEQQEQTTDKADALAIGSDDGSDEDGFDKDDKDVEDADETSQDAMLTESDTGWPSLETHQQRQFQEWYTTGLAKRQTVITESIENCLQQLRRKRREGMHLKPCSGLMKPETCRIKSGSPESRNS